MDCPQCGYKLGPFEQTCPRCAYLARTRSVPAGGSMELPEGAPGYPPTAASGEASPAGLAYKLCPACRQPAVLEMPVCGRCGYQYLLPPAAIYQTQAMPTGASSGYAAPPPYPQTSPPSAAWSREDPNYRARRARRRAMISLGVIFSAVACMAVAALLFTPKPAHQVDAVQQDSHMPTVVKSGGGQGGSSMVGSAVDSRQIDQRLLESQATTGGDIEVSLAWNSLTDLDLQVRDPSGELISAEHRRSASGGVQDVDANPTLLTVEGAMRLLQGQCPGPGTALPIPEEQIDVDKKIGLPDGSPPMNTQPGYGERVGSRFTRTPVEHIYFAHAPRGTYKVYAHCYSWREPNPTPLPFTIQIRSHGKVFYEMTGTLGPASYIIDNTTPTEECQFDVP